MEYCSKHEKQKIKLQKELGQALRESRKSAHAPYDNTPYDLDKDECGVKKNLGKLNFQSASMLSFCDRF